METLLKELNIILQKKNETISSLEFQNKWLENENKELKKQVEELKVDVSKYEENEKKGV